MSLHFPLPKTRTFRFSLHTSRLSLHWEVTIVALKFAMGSNFPLPKIFRPLCSHSFKWREPRDEWSKTQDKRSNPAQSYYRKRGSASYIVHEVLSVRERERERERDTERERRKWRHHCRAKIGDEFTLSLAKNSHNWRWAYTFPCQKFALFVSPFTLPVSPFTERSLLWRWNSQWVHTFHCQNFSRPLCSPSIKWHEPRDEWSKTQDKWSNPAQSYFVLPIEKMNQINTKNYWK